jgi:uncharacterized ion transporter superfamily protein YfcC
MAADDQVCRFFGVFCSVIVRHKANIGRNFGTRLRLIALIKADAAVITAVADYAKKVAPSAADFNNTFAAQRCR